MLCSCLLQNFREKNRASKFFNNLSAVSEAIPALGWVSVVCSVPFISILFLQYKHIISLCLQCEGEHINKACFIKYVDIMQTDVDVLAANKHHQNVFVCLYLTINVNFNQLVACFILHE